MHPREHTIFALATGALPSAIAVVRISGPRAGDALTMLSGSLPPPRVATRALLRDADQAPIDDALVLWFPQPASATGEDVAELHIHGSRAVLAALVKRLLIIDGARAAEPGEFTRRAFENGKLDLTDAEGLDDLIHADTDAQRRQALRQLQGLLGDHARRWRDEIIEAQALIEAGIDFSDEGDVAGELIAPALAKVAALERKISDVLDGQGASERLRDGLVVAIAGPPNVGKSTLVNRLARREVAIVSPHAGTTRDVIEVQLDLGGYPVTVIDTAGIRDSDDPVEQEGVRRARLRASEADLVLWLSVEDGEVSAVEGSGEVWTVRNKIDLDRDFAAEILAIDRRQSQGNGDGQGGSAEAYRFAISAVAGRGVGELISAMQQFAETFFAHATNGIVTRTRHRTLLQSAVLSLRHSMFEGVPEEIVAEDLRAASHALGCLLGRIDVEDVLGSIFASFCIGK
jgi:tRNA modification GTPase